MRGKFLEELDIRRQGAARKNAFEEIVAQQSVFRHFARQRSLKGINIVNSFAGIRAFLEKILVDIRNCRRYGSIPLGPEKIF